jgi:hypothetical protein
VVYGLMAATAFSFSFLLWLKLKSQKIFSLGNSNVKSLERSSPAWPDILNVKTKRRFNIWHVVLSFDICLLTLC